MAADVRDFASRFLRAALRQKRVCVLPHVNADGDAIGSGLALCGLLRGCGYEAVLLLDEAVPERLSFLPEIESVEVYSGRPFTPELLFVIDCHEPQRLARREELWQRAALRFCVDHHRFQGKPGAEEWMEAERSSTAEMIALLLFEFESIRGETLLNQTIATQLSCGIYADTGGLRYSNSGADTYRVMARLREAGVVIDELAEALFNRSSLPRLRARGRAFSKAVWCHGGRVAWAFLDNEDRAAANAGEDDMSGICSDLREVVGTTAAFFFKTDEERQKLHISIRSGEGMNAAALASRLGGGGHDRAAGAEIELAGRDPQAVIDEVLNMAKSMIP